MKATIQTYMKKSSDDLLKEVVRLRAQIAKDGMDHYANPQKNSNAIGRLRKELARVLTVLNQQKAKN